MATNSYSPPDDFVVFILTHGRPDKQYTYQTLLKQGYTGQIYFIVDNEDKTIDRYRSLYGDRVIVFDKLVASRQVDPMDNFSQLQKGVVCARNSCFEIARKLGYTYFLQLDDDYPNFEYRWDRDYRWHYRPVQNLNRLLALVLDFYRSIPAKTICLAQGGDMIGGKDSTTLKSLHLKRKAMNSFFCSTERPFKFIGRINEDVNTYVILGMRGELLLTIVNANVRQKETQTQTGGMTDLYIDSGTYLKSFYPVMCNPSCVRIAAMGESHFRIHHNIRWKHAVPVIISEQYKKV